MITPRTTRQVAASIGLLAVALAACSQGDLRGPESSSELEPALDTTTVWTDTTIIYVVSAREVGFRWTDRGFEGVKVPKIGRLQ